MVVKVFKIVKVITAARKLSLTPRNLPAKSPKLTLRARGLVGEGVMKGGEEAVRSPTP